MNRILVALDTSPAAVAVHRAAVTLAQSIHAKLVLYRVIEGAGEINTPNSVLVAEAEAELDHLARKDPPGLVLGSRATTSETPWRAICDSARTEDVDLIVIGAHKHGALARALGTTAASVVNHAGCSVLVVRQAR